MRYEEFLDNKSNSALREGFAPLIIPDFLFDFQKDLVDWSIRRGRAAIFADCGLGKTPIQLVWAQNVVEKTNKRVLILTPLAVSPQTVREGDKFGIRCEQSRDGKSKGKIVVTNYEKLHLFSPADFDGVVCDESSILKSFDGALRGAITEFMKKVKYRLLCTATAAPNDYTELGTSSEALGSLGHMDMLHRFFRKVDSQMWLGGAGLRHQHGGECWRLKGHAEKPFWRWVCSWARAIRRPSDLGYDDGPFILPPLRETEHLVKFVRRNSDGGFFVFPAVGLKDQRKERSITIQPRCEKVAELVSDNRPALVWCHLNAEGDLLEKLIPDGVQVSGRDSDEAKEEKFNNFVSGKLRVLITKPVIGAWGLNFQHCSHETFFPSHSFEQYYQGVRRCWRFGQKNPVDIDIVTTEGEQRVKINLQRKAKQADEMFMNLVHLMSGAISENKKKFNEKEEVPSWLLPYKR